MNNVKFLSLLGFGVTNTILVILIICRYVSDDNKSREVYFENSLDLNNGHFSTQLRESIQSNGMYIGKIEGADVRSEKIAEELFLSDEPRLICRYSALSCSSCIEFVKYKIDEHFGGVLGSGNILVAVRDQNPKADPWMNPTINTGKKQLSLPTDRIMVPYFFIYDKGVVENIFLPDSSAPEMIDIYFNQIKKRYPGLRTAGMKE